MAQHQDSFSDFRWMAEENLDQFDQEAMAGFAIVDSIVDESPEDDGPDARATDVPLSLSSLTLSSSCVGLNVHAQEFVPGH